MGEVAACLNCQSGCGGGIVALCPFHASAPDMLEVLEELVRVIEPFGTVKNQERYVKARAIIAKATGKEV